MPDESNQIIHCPPPPQKKPTPGRNVYLQMSRAFLASPETADTLRAQN